ncbi:MAG: T9SS type A sorting domain-containing protein [Bacteroidetes bacterium]|nr:T9SS type A sorting domain-containing protein [Bacteroidota bacterium]
MKKLYYFLLGTFLCPYSSYSQIFYEDHFEDWDTLATFQEPVGWETSNFDSIVYVYPTLDEYDGKLAAAITGNSPDGNGFLEPGNMIRELSPSEIMPNQLRVHVRHTDIIDTSYAAIYLGIYYDTDNYQSQRLWLNHDEITDWTELILPLDFNIDGYITSFVIKFYAGPVKAFPGYEGNGVLYVDNLILETVTPTSTKDQVVQELQVWPNPADEGLHIKLPPQVAKPEYILTDAMGRVIHQAPLTNDYINTAELPNGLYNLQVREGGKLFQSRILVQH